MPTVMVPDSWLRTEKDVKKKLPIAERALRAFAAEGLLGDRTRKVNLYGGYPCMFRELFEPPPWTCVEPEDVDGSLSEERKSELRPLYLHCLERGTSLLEEYEPHLLAEGMAARYVIPESVVSEDLLERLQTSDLLDLAMKINLASLLGRENLENIHDALFESDVMLDDFEVISGAPDLFLWHPDPQRALWLFVEVKGPRDHLRPSQTKWIRRNWERVKGRVVLLTIEADS